MNRDGRESVYFARIDPRFDERYEAMYAAATTPNGMKEFVVEFARNDPKGRVLAVFSKLLVQMRAQNSFEGYYTAFQLLGEPRDYAGMERTAVSAEQKSVIQSIEAEKQAQVRRQQAAEQEEARRRDAQLMAQQQAEQARLAEQRCLATPDCLREMESRRAACVQSIQNCRGQCDRLSGAGSFNSFISNLAAAGISAACSRACKCESSFGDLLARFNNASSGNSSGSTRANVATSNPAPASARAPALTVDAAPSRRSIEAPAAKPTQRELSDHVCALNCKGPDGKASITVQAGDAAEAARLVDPQGHQICKRAGYEAATPIRMSASQCRKK